MLLSESLGDIMKENQKINNKEKSCEYYVAGGKRYKVTRSVSDSTDTVINSLINLFLREQNLIN